MNCLFLARLLVAALPPGLYSIAGTITGGAGATVWLDTLDGHAPINVTADSSGTYTFAGLRNGSYTVSPQQTDRMSITFSPARKTITIRGADVSGINFIAVATSSSVFDEQIEAGVTHRYQEQNALSFE